MLNYVLVETAAVLCLVYGKFIEAWRQKEAVLQTSQMTKLLLANASHECPSFTSLRCNWRNI